MTPLVSKEHALPPYTAVAYGNGVWAGVENKNGFNALSFEEFPGAKFTSFDRALKIAEEWNKPLNATTSAE